MLDKTSKLFKYILLAVWVLAFISSMFYLSFASNFTIFSYIGWFIIGKYLYKFVKTYNLILVSFIILSTIFSVILNLKASIKYDMFYNLFFTYRTPFTIVSAISMFILVYNLYPNKSPNKIIIILSDLSLGGYLIQGILLDVTSKYVDYTSINALIGIPLFILIFS